MKQLLFRLYVRFIRPYSSRALYKLYEKIQPTTSILWDVYKKLPMREFSDKINSYEYIPDIGDGALDYSFDVDNPNYFFSDLLYGRDCGAWARLWKAWALENGYIPQEVVITTKEHIIRDAHVVCVLEKDDEYWMCDYIPYGPYKSMEQAIEDLPNHWTKYTAENMIWENYC